MSKIFVFGSNLAGIHGAGAAKFAHEQHHAIFGQGIGRTGSAYAIPTKDENILTMPVTRIVPHIDVFRDYAKVNCQLDFYVSRVGCGLAGYTDAQIAPLFHCMPNNVFLPEEWKPLLTSCPISNQWWAWEKTPIPNRAEVERKESDLAKKYRRK